ncbi:MAG: hypothetical protein ACOY91_10630 [Pseudomonadota bacterium]
MGQIENVHQPEDQREADREQEHQHAQLHAIKKLNQKELHASHKFEKMRASLEAKLASDQNDFVQPGRSPAPGN